MLAHHFYSILFTLPSLTGYSEHVVRLKIWRLYERYWAATKVQSQWYCQNDVNKKFE